MAVSSDIYRRYQEIYESLQRARLSLKGLWMGDAFGGSFFWKGDFQEQLRKRELSPSPWRWSDDTAMGQSVVTCLGLRQEIQPETLACLFAREYQREPVRGYGTMAHGVLDQLSQGVPWQQASRSIYEGAGSCGNGAAMRVGPVGAYFAGDIEKVLEQARRSALVTHAHPEGQAGALAVAAAAAWAAEHRTPDGPAMLEWACSHTPKGETRSGLERALALPLDRAPQEAAGILGCGEKVTSQDTVPFALWCAARHLDSYSEALWAAVAGGGDMDTTCAIVGSIVVLSAGDGIPQEWESRAEPHLADLGEVRRATLGEVGESLLADEHFEEAIQVFRKLLEEHPDDWRGHLGLGHAYFKQDKIRDGLGHYQEVARLAPAEAGPAFLARAELLLRRQEKNARIWFLHAADCFREKNDVESYEAVCRRLVELGWENDA